MQESQFKLRSGAKARKTYLQAWRQTNEVQRQALWVLFQIHQDNMDPDASTFKFSYREYLDTHKTLYTDSDPYRACNALRSLGQAKMGVFVMHNNSGDIMAESLKFMKKIEYTPLSAPRIRTLQQTLNTQR